MGSDVYGMIACAALAGLAIVASAGLAGWHGWLALQRRRLEVAGAAPDRSAGGRIELADLRERVRRLEAIAAGVDL